jgi:signal-transduction protein with cAMP-binding, CBS, and nucleotidyltransferase domain
MTVARPESPVGVLRLGRIIRVRADADLREVAARLRMESPAAAWLDGDVGLVTEADLVRALAVGLGPTDPAATVAVANPPFVEAGMTVSEAAVVMLRADCHQVLVRHHGSPIGLLDLTEIVAVLVAAADPAVWMLSVHLAGRTKLARVAEESQAPESC